MIIIFRRLSCDIVQAEHILKKFLLLAGLVLIVAAAIGWRFYVISHDDKNAGRKRSAPVVSVEKAAIESIEETFQSVGSVESPQKVELSPKVSGRIEMLEVHPGDYVSKGTVLVRLDQGELEEQVNQSKAELAAAELTAAKDEAAKAAETAAAELAAAKDEAEKALAARDEEIAGLNESISDLKESIATSVIDAVKTSTSIPHSPAPIKAAQAESGQASTGKSASRSSEETTSVTVRVSGMTGSFDVTVKRTLDGVIKSVKLGNTDSDYDKVFLSEVNSKKFLNQFVGKSGQITDVDTVSGATYTSQAVINAVNSLTRTGITH